MLTTLRRWSLGLFALSLLSMGCAQPVNPSFPVTMQDARNDLARMGWEPVPLARPLVVIGGIAEIGMGPVVVSDQMDSICMHEGIVPVGIGECPTFNMCRNKVIEKLEAVYPSGDPKSTVEVDVIGLSMGGVVARYAALPREGGKRLRIARLFTISSPLQGSNEARWIPAFFPVIKDLRKGDSYLPTSTFLEKLNAREPEYPVFSYVRLHDIPVGAENAALPGRVAWWVAAPFPSSPHAGAILDARILADIARRLRNERPLALNPPAPLPAKG